MEELKIPEVKKDAWVVVPCSWSLHFINRDSYRSKIDSIPKGKSIVFDLRRVTYIDCSSIIMLQELSKQYNKEKETLFLLGSNDYVQTKLVAYGDKAIHLYTSLNAIMEKMSV